MIPEQDVPMVEWLQSGILFLCLCVVLFASASNKTCADLLPHWFGFYLFHAACLDENVSFFSPSLVIMCVRIQAFKCKT